MINFLVKAKAAAIALARRPKDALILILMVILAWLGWRLKSERKKSDELTAKIEGMPPGTQQVVEVSRDRVITRWREGPTKIEYRDRYLPPEGKVEVVARENPSPSDKPEVRIKDSGFTFRLGGGTIYSERLLLEADAKFAYWKRYSLLAGINSEFGGVGVARHIDDFTPFHNLEFFGLGGLSWRGTFRVGIGIRSNF